MIKIGQIEYDIMNCTYDFYPIKIDIAEKFDLTSVGNYYGKSRVQEDNSSIEVSLEFDAETENSIIGLRNYLQSRKCSKKIFLNEPSTYQQYSTDYLVSSGFNLSDTIPGAVTAFSAGDLTNMRLIDSNYYSKADNTKDYTYLIFNFDINNFISAYGIDAVEYITLFLHNPYCSVTGQDTIPGGYRILVYSDKNSKWYQLSEQSYSLSDVNLRADGLMNQQFYTIKKTAEFISIRDCITSSRYVKFAMVNKEPGNGNTNTLGLNCVGVLVNGFGVRQSNVDNFTFRDIWDGGGYTGSVSLEGAI